MFAHGVTVRKRGVEAARGALSTVPGVPEPV
jgi:hypothetical protein